MAGTFISFEGIDGAGKSTHIERLRTTLAENGRTVLLTREPGGTPVAEQLRGLVLNEAMDPLTEALLVFAARRDHVVQVIRPALARGELVLCDRFADATFAYQGGGRGFEWDTLRQLELWVLGNGDGTVLQPDITLWFDVPAAVAAERLANARAPDKFESQSQAFFERVSAGYARRCDEQPARFARINGHQSLESVWSEVREAVRARGLLP